MNQEINWKPLSEMAWDSLKNAVADKTKVGAALISEDGNYFSGCNIEQTYRNKDIHAEVCAISKMISSGNKRFVRILVVSDRERFTPCGTCMDWIFQFGGPNVIVAYQNEINGEIHEFTAQELMPHYPF